MQFCNIHLLFLFLVSTTLALKSTKLKWKPCEEFLCADLIVPLDYLNPESKSLKIPITKYPAAVQPALDKIIIQPDGPGLFGINMVKLHGHSLSTIFNHRVDIIGFDHRSSRLKCGYKRKSVDNYLKKIDYFIYSSWTHQSDIGNVQRLDEAVRGYIHLCGTSNLKYLKNTSTLNVARDLELMRIALGMGKMNLWGMNYGSVLGITYANMFPDKVGKIILDGAVNPVHYYGSIAEYTHI
jgi:hypothetical protein